MRLGLIASLILLVVVPVTALGVLALRLMDGEQEGLRQQVAQVLKSDLQRRAATIDALVQKRFSAVEDQLPSASDDAAKLRLRLGETPWISAFFKRRADGGLSYPDPKGSLTNSERRFLQRSAQLWARGAQFAKPDEAGATAPKQGWTPWLHEHGLHLIAWARLKDGSTVGAELDRMRFLADLIASLPSSEGNNDERRVLRDGRGEVVYQWGGFEPQANAEALVQAGLAEPLRGWRVELYLSHASFAGRMGTGIRVALFSGIGALALALMLLALFLYRGTERARREAMQRVTFVNQVSHELKTPLTNIRLYAELLEGRLDEDQTKARRDLSVIVSESQRLSRLINNVLGFARQGRSEPTLSAGLHAPEDVISDVLRQFAPALKRASLSVELHLAAPKTMRMDKDAIAQIVANLVSNVEKYAAGGGTVSIHCIQDKGQVRLRIHDRGPGVAPAFRKRLFEPFSRAQSALTEGVSGTGIGLALARQIAEAHGGSLRLLESEEGACFELLFAALEEVR